MPIVLLIILIGILVGVALATRAARGTPVLTEPRCAKCGYDLRGSPTFPPTRCSECGSDLSLPHAVRWGEFRKRPRVVWVIVTAGVLALVGISALFFGRSTMSARSTTRTNTRTNTAVLSSLATTVNQPNDWRDVDSRLAAGRLSNTEAAQAIELLIKDLAKTAGASRGPLSWSEGFVARAESRGAISDEQYLRLARAYYGPGNVTIAPRARQGAKLPFRLQYGGHWQLPGVQLVKALRQVKLEDGREIQATGEEDAYRRKKDAAAPNPDYLSAESPRDINGSLTIDLPPGEHVLTFVFDNAALLPQTAPRIVSNKPGQAKNWPNGRMKWTEEIKVPVTVIAGDKSPVAMVNDPALDPRATGAIKVKALRVIRIATGQRVAVDLSIESKVVPCSFDVLLRTGGVEYPMGYYVCSANGTSGSGLAVDFKSLPADARAADLLFRPNPSHAEGMPGVDRIWGSAVELSNVRMQRYDLEAEAASQPTAVPQ